MDNGIKNYLTDKSYNEDFGISSDYDIPNFQDNSNYNLEKFDYPIFSNCLPHIDVFLDNGYTKEEEKMINETRKILKRPDLKIQQQLLESLYLTVTVNL